MKKKLRISLLSIIILVVIAILLILFISWIFTPKAKITTDDQGNKTIETPQETPKTDLVEATTEVQAKFVTSDVTIVNKNGFTVTTGKIKNNDSKKHDVSIQVNFFNDKNRIAGSASTVVTQLASGETRDFTMTTMGDLTKNKSEVKVEFTN